MATIISDTIDFSGYMAATEPKSKVLRASQFEDQIAAELENERNSIANVSMFSTKLRDRMQFRPGEVTAYAGYNGHRKSMLSGQIALDLCVQKQRVLIVSLEMQPFRTLHRMLRQASGLRSPSNAYLRSFSKWTDNKLWVFDHMGRISPSLCLAVLRYFADELKGQHVLIDSMMMVCASEESMDEQKQFTTDLVRVAQETSLHIHLLTHCRKPQAGEDKPPTKYDLRGSAAISDQAHNVITVWANKPKVTGLAINPHDSKLLQEPDARIAVEKQRNGAWEGAVQLWFDDASLRFMDDRMSPVTPYRGIEA